MKQKINKVISLFLIVVMVLMSFTPQIDSYASSVDGAIGGQGGVYPGDGSGGMWLYTIGTIPNVSLDSDRNKSVYQKDGKYVGNPYVSLLKTSIQQFPEEYFSPDRIKRTFGSMQKNGYATQTQDWNYVTAGGASGDPMGPSYGGPSDGWNPNFMKSGMRRDYDTATGSSGGASNPYWGAVWRSANGENLGFSWDDIANASNIVEGFVNGGSGVDPSITQNVENLASLMATAMWDYNGTALAQIWNKYTSSDSADPLRAQAYTFTAYCAVANMIKQQRGSLPEEVKSALVQYFTNRNTPDSQEFVCFQTIMVAGQRLNGSNKPPTMWTMPAGIATATGVGLDQIINQSSWYNAETGLGVTNSAAEMQAYDVVNYKNAYTGGKVIQGNSWFYHYWGMANNLMQYTGSSKNGVVTPVGAAYIFRHVLPNGKWCGIGGFGMFTDRLDYTGVFKGSGGGGGKPDDPGFQINVTANPKNKQVEVNQSETAEIKVNLGMTNDQISKMKSKWSATSNPNCYVKITGTWQKIEGNSDGNHWEVATNTGYNVVSNSGANIIIQSPAITDLNTLLDYLNGGKSTLTFLDSNIIVQSDIKNKYKFTAEVRFTNGTWHQSIATGKEIENSYTAYDTANWKIKNDKPHFYSTPEVPSKNKGDSILGAACEIKQGRPGNERFEAMAGVPTTEDMYVGFGATEFMTNIDLEWKQQNDATRTYTITVTAPNEIGKNQPCTGPTSCPGHSEGDPPKIVYHSPTHTCSFGSFFGSDGTVTTYRNSAHPGTTTFKITITQKIENFSYMDITNEQVWQLMKAIYKEDIVKGSKELLDTPNFEISPNTGYDTFYNQDKYYSNNGRLLFSVALDNNQTQKWGDSSVSKVLSSGLTHQEARTQACNIMNQLISGISSVQARSISDFLVLNTSEGYQSVMYFDYLSNNVPLGVTVQPSDFGAEPNWQGSPGSVTLTHNYTANPITWPKVPDVNEMWTNNSRSASNWNDDDITRSGYTGNYSEVTSKYTNDNKRLSNSNTAEYVIQQGHPSVQRRGGSTSFNKNESNMRLVKTGLNIIDSTDSNKNWSKDDGVSPVVNGEKDFMHGYIYYENPIYYGANKGNDWSQYTAKNIEVPYTTGKKKMNNIIIHNPISNRDAVVVSNDKKYDQRVTTALDKIGEPPVDNSVCPRDDTCQFAHLQCTIPYTAHTASCYSSYKQHVGGYNAHVHTADCYKGNNFSKTTDPPVVTWRFTSSGCTYSGDYLWTNGSYPTLTDFRRDITSSGHTNCFNDGTFTQISSTGGKQYYQIPSEGAIYGVDGNSYYIDVPYSPNESIYKAYYSVDYYNYEIWYYKKDATYHVIERRQLEGSPDKNYWKDLSCSLSSDSYSRSRQLKSEDCTYVTWVDFSGFRCTNELNTHVCTAACTNVSILNCSNPHHYIPGAQPVPDRALAKNHYAFGTMGVHENGGIGCYVPCNNDNNHKKIIKVIDDKGQELSTTGTFVNIGREIEIYYPDTGDFSQSPNMQGILETTSIRGKGYTNNMDTEKWLRNKFVKFTFPVIYVDQDTGDKTLYRNGDSIDLLKLKEVPGTSKHWKFYIPLAVSEKNYTPIEFNSIANNSPETYNFSDNVDYWNRDRDKSTLKAKQTAHKIHNIDVVGNIGSLTINDTGDWRFSELFKQKDSSGSWLVDNIVHKVDYSKPNKIVSDDKDVRGEPARNNGGYFHSPFGVTKLPTGGKGSDYVTLPLAPYKNNIKSLQTSPMLPGYNLYMDVETIGNYYGDTQNSEGEHLDSGLIYRMQLKPRYWALNLTTGQYTQVDAYMYKDYSYLPIVMSNKDEQTSEYYYYLRWLDESMRRSYTTKENSNSIAVQAYNTASSEGKTFYWRLPTNTPKVLGSANRLFLNDLTRTFIGDYTSYGENWLAKTTEGASIDPEQYYQQSQRWHYTIGLPSSTVFVESGKDCNKQNIDKIKNGPYVIVCALNTLVRGEVWTLGYDGSALNSVGIKVYPDGTKGPNGEDWGKTYSAPKESDGAVIKDPVIVVYDNKKTSETDLQITGTH